MAELSSLLTHFKPSGIAEVFTLASQLKADGHDIIDLSVGEPDFMTPDHIKQAGIDAINNNQTKYTPVAGTQDLHRAIQRKFKRDNNLDYSLSQIVVDAGAKPMLFHALQAMLEPGGEVIIPTPSWASYEGMVTLAQGLPVFVRCEQNDGFKMQAQALEAAITPNTRVIMLNSPSNPTGAAYTRAEMKALTDVLLRHPQIWIIADDIYEHIVYDDFRFVTPAEVEPRLYARTLTINGVSKAYSMTGWRIGYAGGPEHLIKAIIKILSQNNGNPCSISQAAAVVALNGPQDALKGKAAQFKARRDYMLERLADIDGLSCHAPEGAFYLYPSCEGLLGLSAAGHKINTSSDLAKYLLLEAGIAVVPGAAFGYDPNIRISYATSMDNLVLACARLETVCAALS